ncbi:MAG: hypothetical protein KAT56_10750, partial [Sedimentisphaerales bacterium]|nr:hypothetical protein [Sedimentisphaerales bacterium]
MANTNVGDVVSTVGTIGDTATAVTITATNGTVGTVSAVGDDGADVGINVDLTAGGNITAVTALDPDEADGGIMGTITSNSGNIGTVSTIDADIAATITATLGDVDSVIANPDGVTLIPDTGNVTGAITAGGDIDAVTGNDITSTIISKAATADSPVTVFTYNNIAYTFDATSGPSYSYTFNGAAKTIDITVDNATAQAADVDIALTTDVATGGSAGNVDDAPFDLLSLDFTAASATGNFDNLGTLAVEGDVDGQIVTGTINALLVEGDVELPVLASKTAADNAVTAVAVGSAQGVDDPTAAGLQSMFDDPDVGDSVVFGAPADPSVFTVTAANPTSAGDDVSFSFGTTGAVLSTPILLTEGIGDTAAEYQVTVSGDAITSIDGYTTTDGNVTIDGDLAYMITAWDLDTVTITGNILETGGVNAKDIGNIVVGTAADSFSTYGDAAAAQAALDLTGDMAGTITSAEVIVNSAVAMAGNIGSVTILGDLTGTITADGSVGAVNIGQSVANLNGTKVAQTGLMSGSLVAGVNLTSLTTELSQSGNVIVTDTSGSIVSTEGDVGGVVMVGDSLTTVTAGSGNVTADIFIGGDAGGADAVAITGLGITGELVIGATNGVDTLTLTLKADATDANPVVYTIAATGGAGMLVEIENDENPVSASGVTVDAITMIEVGDLALSVNNDASIDLDELYLFSDADIDLDVEGDVGLIVAADDIDTPTSAELDAEFSATYSVVNAPTALDAVLSDGGIVNLEIDIDADNVTGGVIASGDLTVGDGSTVNVVAFGYMLSLNGTVDAEVATDDSIGSIAASGDISATLETEGVIAIDDASDMQADVADLGLSGLPSWFAGGVLSEIGDVDIDATADGVQDSSTIMGIPVSGSGSEYAMGTVYAMIGEVEGTYDLGAGFGGIVAPMDDLNAGSTPTVNVPLSSQIDMFVAPYTNGGTVGGTTHPTPQLNLVDGEVLVSENNPYVSDYDSVTAVGSGVLAYVDGSAVVVISGLNDAAAEVNIEGNVSSLTVDTDWAGTVRVMENADGDNGEITGWLTVNGDVDADTADLVAYNFAGYTHSGEVTGTSPVDANQFVEEGVLDWSNNSVSWTNLAGDDQTLYMWGSYTVSAEYETFFGKLNSVDIVGQG